MKAWLDQSKDEKKATLVTLEAQGLCFPQIADVLNITKGSLHGFYFRNNIPQPPSKRSLWRSLRTKEARLAKVSELDDQKMQPREMSRVLGISEVQILEMVRRAKKPLLNSGRRAWPPRFDVLPDLPPETWAPVVGSPVGYLDNNGCKWPIEVDGKSVGCCGAAPKVRVRPDGSVKKLSYCEHHHAVAHRPAGPVAAVVETSAKPKPVSSQAAMKMAGVAPRRMEVMD